MIPTRKPNPVPHKPINITIQLKLRGFHPIPTHKKTSQSDNEPSH